VIQSFRTWGTDFDEVITRWQIARARPMIHLTTADNNDGHELITPAQIAAGGGDRYLVRLNKLFYEKGMRAYVRPLGEPNRCLNVYAAYDCSGASRGPEHSPRAYKQAFRRIYVVVHGGGKAKAINRRLAEAGLPPLTVNVRALPKSPVAIVWSPLPAGSPTVPRNRPKHFYPGSRWVDWAGTDFYSGYPEWKALTGLYRRFSGKPFAITEWAVESGDEIAFLHEIEAGPASRSYGVQVARLAGMPPALLRHARFALERLEAERIARQPQIDLFAGAAAAAGDAAGHDSEKRGAAAVANSALGEAVAALDPDILTPREALDALYRLKALHRDTS